MIEFRQPDRAQRRMVGHGTTPSRLLFELRDAQRTAAFQPTPHTCAAALVKVVRDMVFDRLADALPERREALERAIMGRGDCAPDPRSRIRFIPLPSIGLTYTSPSIRRLLVEVPAGAPLTLAEVSWALADRVFGGHADADGVIAGQTLLAPAQWPAADDAMTARYLRKSTVWRSVTPVALPHLHPAAARDGSAQAGLMQQAALAVAQALRHAHVEARAVSVHVQGEPFRRRGRHAAEHDADRFGSARLHHLELRLDRAVEGPLLVGDGRWLGLGLMEPVTESPVGLHVFRIEGERPPSAMAFAASRALRRAVMARVQAALGATSTLPTFFSGHEPDGRPAAGEQHQHLFYLADDADADGRLDRLAVVAPRLPPGSTAAEQLERSDHLATLADAVQSLTWLRAGPAGLLALRLADADEHDPLFGMGRVWTSRTPYQPTRQPKRAIEVALQDDVRRECARRCLPLPQEIDILGTAKGTRGRVTAHIRLHFATAVSGPLLLGDGAHFGRGLFHTSSRATVGTSLRS